MPENIAKKSRRLKAINTYFIYLNQSCFLINLNKKPAIIKKPRYWTGKISTHRVMNLKHLLLFYIG
jgi:hypothetical protein